MRTFIAALAVCLLASGSARASEADPDLVKTVTDLDRQAFDAYNRCDLAAFGKWFAPDVEFFHDDGGATVGRDIVVENTRKYICGKVQRVLTPGSLKVYPIKGYGAIEEGLHGFRSIAEGQGGGIAKFLIIWKRTGDDWQITKVVSYGHMPGPDAK